MKHYVAECQWKDQEGEVQTMHFSGDSNRKLTTDLIADKIDAVLSDNGKLLDVNCVEYFDDTKQLHAYLDHLDE